MKNVFICFIACVVLSVHAYAALPANTPEIQNAYFQKISKQRLIGHNQGQGIGAINTGVNPTDPQQRDKQNLDPSKDKNAEIIKMAQDKIHEKYPDQKGGYVAEIIDKGTVSEVTARNPEFFGGKTRNSGNPVEIGKLIAFDENGNTIAEDFYIKGGGNGNRYGVDKLEYVSMPYGKYNVVYQDQNGSSQTWRDTDGQWINNNNITMRVSSNPNSAIMSPRVTTERIHPGGGFTHGCYGLLPDSSLATTTYGLNPNLQSITTFANARVYLGKINGLSSNGNQILAGYRTPVLGKTSL